jgi:lysophospholipase L1-like esterase
VLLSLAALLSIWAPVQARSNGRPPAQTVSVARPGAYAALGASETYGIGAAPRTKGYAYLVARDLHARRFVDLGIPGTTLNSAYQTELTNALAIHPYLCTVFFGFNDLAAGVQRRAFLQDLHDFVATLRQAHARVVIIGLPDLSLVPIVARLHLSGVKHIVNSWDAGMASVARQTGATFLDLRRYSREIALHPQYFAADGLHPSNAAHARLAQVVVSVVQQHHLWKAR